jgi:hypothetical protein
MAVASPPSSAEPRPEMSIFLTGLKQAAAELSDA